MSRREAALNAILAVLTVLVAVAGAALLVMSKPQPQRAEVQKPEVRVQVMRARPGLQDITVTAMGEVKPAHELIVQPEVPGRVIDRSDNLIPGGIVQKGEVLVRIDGRDQSAVLAAQRAAVAQAQLSLADERTRKEVAVSEWGSQASSLDKDSADFALREPHAESARASLASAREQLARAKRDLGRTAVRAPFDAVVREVSVEPGQVAGTQTRLATLVNVDRYWVEVAVPVANLAHLDIPGINVAGLRGSPARVIHEAGPGVRIERTGYVERLLTGVDTKGRLARLLIAVEDPLALGTELQSRPLPLLLGSYVRVELGGQPIDKAVMIPRTALVDGKFVWLVADSLLTRREVEVVWRDAKNVIAQGLRDGESVLVTPLAAPTEGMEVIVDEEVVPAEGAGGGRRELTSIAGKG
ncbi:MAG: efflux RND transporter periplasmic adaptor subunit [Nannocystaceae bacterium]